MATPNTRSVKGNFFLISGRLVWGSVWEKKAERFDTTTNKNVPIDPSKQRLEFSLLIPKKGADLQSDPNAGMLFSQAAGVAQQAFGGHMGVSSLTPGDKEFLIADGDGPKHRNPDGSYKRDFTRGHWIITAISYAPLAPIDANAQHILHQAGLKAGDYVTVSLYAKSQTGNGNRVRFHVEGVRKDADGESLVSEQQNRSASEIWGAAAAPTGYAPPAMQPMGMPQQSQYGAPQQLAPVMPPVSAPQVMGGYAPPQPAPATPQGFPPVGMPAPVQPPAGYPQPPQYGAPQQPYGMPPVGYPQQ